VCRVISRSIADYLVQAWDVRNTCKHSGAVLPVVAAPVATGGAGPMALMLWLDGMMMMMMVQYRHKMTGKCYKHMHMAATAPCHLPGMHMTPAAGTMHGLLPNHAMLRTGG
jgi:hypothetical protein